MSKRQKAQPKNMAAGSGGSVGTAAQGTNQARDKTDELAARLSQRENELAEAQMRLAAMEKMLQVRDASVATLQAEVGRLQAALQQGGAAGAVKGARPQIHDVVDQLPKHATARYATRPIGRITHLCIHHSATSGAIPLENVAKYHVEDRGWAGIGYHFYVKPDGAIYQTNRLETISFHVSNNNDYSVGICVSGDFTYAPPPDKQIDATARLVAWLMQELSVPESNVLGHKEFPNNDTSCPGETWLKKPFWKNTLIERVRAVRAPASLAIGHYMLFWQTPDAWAREDWQAAESYIGRFRPTAGFSVDDAKTARFVTIVGGAAGVPVEAEQQLRAAGSQVERLAGVDFADTKRMLDELAKSGKRFQSLAG